jgi:hypothetical protein
MEPKFYISPYSGRVIKSSGRLYNQLKEEGFIVDKHRCFYNIQTAQKCLNRLISLYPYLYPPSNFIGIPKTYDKGPARAFVCDTKKRDSIIGIVDKSGNLKQLQSPIESPSSPLQVKDPLNVLPSVLPKKEIVDKETQTAVEKQLKEEEQPNANVSIIYNPVQDDFIPVNKETTVAEQKEILQALNEELIPLQLPPIKEDGNVSGAVVNEDATKLLGIVDTSNEIKAFREPIDLVKQDEKTEELSDTEGEDSIEVGTDIETEGELDIESVELDSESDDDSELIDVKTESETESELDDKSESIDVKTESETESETDESIDVKTESETESKSDDENESIDGKTESETNSETKSESIDVKTESETESELDDKSESIDVKTESETESETKSESIDVKTESDTKSELESETIDVKIESETDSESDDKIESVDVIVDNETKGETEVVPEVDSETEVVPETIKAEVVPETIKVDSETEATKVDIETVEKTDDTTPKMETLTMEGIPTVVVDQSEVEKAEKIPPESEEEVMKQLDAKCLEGEQYDVNTKRCLPCTYYNLTWNSETKKCRVDLKRNVVVTDGNGNIVGYL